jgi:hypothetical protein
MTSALDGGEWSASRPGRAFTPGERTSGTHCTGGWVGPRAGLDTEDRGKILCPCRVSNPDRPVVQPVVRHYGAPNFFLKPYETRLSIFDYFTQMTIGCLRGRLFSVTKVLLVTTRTYASLLFVILYDDGISSHFSSCSVKIIKKSLFNGGDFCVGKTESLKETVTLLQQHDSWTSLCWQYQARDIHTYIQLISES